ncbi:hypothetical protein WICMUC_005392 [Wickerhamomyces mucosus]|uniref:NADH-ubiquinone oxidoreductase n=1 Tax=Wickerhamomyces mucosus TaxID=1378264 RepID=A0A9P8P8N0_9ASCO|nr:hypothetical protein WICMUC_005392 [Wickerhamomyces mucosus]
MGNKREPSHNHTLLIDPEPLIKEIPQVDEVGASSAPLVSVSYFIGDRCAPYNEDFMLCKEQAKDGGEIECLKEGRRVTRCASSVIRDINENCAESFKLHWQCLNNSNYELFKCRKAEILLNKCVFEKLQLEKKIPGVKEQIHLKEKPIYKPIVEDRPSVIAYDLAKKEKHS